MLVVGGETTNSVVVSSAEIYDPVAGTFSATDSMSIPREVATATLLPDGRVLIAGGENGTSAVSSAETYDPTSGAFTLLLAQMTTSRAGHSAVLLNNGKVLLVGGIDNTNTALKSAELFDPTTNTFSATGSMQNQRVLQVSAPLHDGRVIVAGGVSTSGVVHANAEIYDPVAGSFKGAGVVAMNVGREDPAVATLADGKVLVAGGDNSSGSTVSSAELFNPITAAFASTSSHMTQARWRAAGSYTQPSVP